MEHGKDGILLRGDERFTEDTRQTGALGHQEWLLRVAALTILRQRFPGFES